MPRDAKKLIVYESAVVIYTTIKFLLMKYCLGYNFDKRLVLMAAVPAFMFTLVVIVVSVYLLCKWDKETRQIDSERE